MFSICDSQLIINANISIDTKSEDHLLVIIMRL